MATTKNITIKQYNGTDYDTLNPTTVVDNVSGAAKQSDLTNVSNVANAAIPKSGGDFTGDVKAYTSNRGTSGGDLRNAAVVFSGSSPTQNLVPTNCLIFSRS